MRDVTNNLLPTVKELIGLDLEWGVPIHWPLKSQLPYEVEIEAPCINVSTESV